MIRITIVTGYPILTEMARKVTDPTVELQVKEVVGEKAVSSLDLSDCDVVIGRGATYIALKERFQNSPNPLPCVELQVSGYDVIKALQECKAQCGARTIAVIGSQNMVDGVPDVAESLGFQLLHFIATNEDDTRRSLQASIDQGVRVIIGGGLVNRLAHEFGVSVFIIKSGETAILHAIEEAKRTAAVAMRERAIAVRMRTILDSVYEAIIAVDMDGLITVCNTPAKHSLGIQGKEAEDLKGRHISEVMPGSLVQDVLESSIPQLGVVYKKDKNTFVKNLQPIMVDNKITGVVITFQEAVSLQEMEGKVRYTMHQKGHTARYTFNDCIGDSFAIQEALAKAIKFSRVGSNIILYGETGTGKEVFAQSIHNASPRKEGPFVAVNCAALPENLLESELFGYVSGAFTGAARGGKMGLFEMAHGGTIFLDEVSEFPVSLQGRLLRVLQEQRVMRLGHDRVLPIDVRVIAASNRDLSILAEQGLFRQDLLYRLDVLHITIPPLRERSKDISVLAAAFMRECGVRLRGHPMYMAEEAKEVLRMHDWPGNIRELFNMCERVCALANTHVVQPRDIYDAFDQFKTSCPLPQYTPHNAEEAEHPAQQYTIEEALAMTRNNKTKAARLLGISRTTMWRRMRENGYVT